MYPAGKRPWYLKPSRGKKKGSESAGVEGEHQGQDQDRSSTEDSAAGPSVPTTSAEASCVEGEGNAATLGHEPAAVAGGATPSQYKSKPDRKELAAMAWRWKLEAILKEYREPVVVLAEEEGEEAAADVAFSNAPGPSQAPLALEWYGTAVWQLPTAALHPALLPPLWMQLQKIPALHAPPKCPLRGMDKCPGKATSPSRETL
ncbi:uncharacterized protein LOC144820036 [Lissotriton helveticus]